VLIETFQSSPDKFAKFTDEMEKLYAIILKKYKPWYLISLYGAPFDTI